MSGKLSDLKHTKRDLPCGKVIILDRGGVISPEDEAMIQALHSRSIGGVEHHLRALDEKGSKDMMEIFYVGYNHKSIGDCGDTTIFIEGPTMLVAKAIQDNPLYSGQESSTRYIDFSKQPFIDPTQTEKGAALMEMQRAFYIAAQEPTRAHLRTLHPRPNEESETRYTKAINARAFDITRSLLPAGASTNLAWHTNLRQAADKLLFLRHHPLEEVRIVAETILDALQEHHPNSFGHKRYPETEAYQDLIAKNYLFHDPKSPAKPRIDFRDVDREGIEKARALFEKRPPKTEVPKYLGQLGTITAEFQLDFGSYRDIQRHRAINQRMPLLTTELGFNSWYIENFALETREKIDGHLAEVNQRISDLGISPEKAQYFIPMGYNISNRFTGDLPAVIYMLELRASPSVHPTLQRVAYNMARQVQENLKIPLHVSDERGRFDIKRGDHDITIKTG